jgi:hypothetical protein
LLPLTSKTPATERSEPINAFLATESPPAVVKLPPLIAETASVVFEIARPPESLIAPVELLVLGVVSSKTTEPLVALEVLRIVVLSFAEVPPVSI